MSSLSIHEIINRNDFVSLDNICALSYSHRYSVLKLLTSLLEGRKIDGKVYVPYLLNNIGGLEKKHKVMIEVRLIKISKNGKTRGIVRR